jgi:hypothetical protein
MLAYADALPTALRFAESMLDLAITSLAALHDLNKTSGQRNSRTGR